MNTKDLMIGSWVNRKYYNPNPINPTWELEKCQVVGVRSSNIIVRLKGGSHSVIDYWEGVVLSEEILLSFGFKKLGKYTFYKSTFKIHKRKRGFVIRKSIPIIDYLHQLQVAYKVFTGKELAIEL